MSQRKRLPKPRGRQPKLTDYVAKAIPAFIKAGAFKKDAAAAVGIAEGTLYRWLDPVASPRELYQEFRESVERAEASAVVVATTRVYDTKPELWLAQSGNWREPDRNVVTVLTGDVIDARRIEVSPGLSEYLDDRFNPQKKLPEKAE